MSGAVLDAGVAARGPGRPRTEGHDERILDTVTRLIDDGAQVTVNAVVAGSGVSRAALYRRWPSMTDLIAAALDRGRAAVEVDLNGDIKQALVALLFGDPSAVRGATYTERRFRTRLALVMQNPELQQAYWTSHVRRRRGSVHAALAEAVRRGELRDDIDIDACIDMINGVFYYQAVVRGSRIEAPDVRARCRAAFEVAWRGMAA
ncbi:TetR/AcrR family transcriptional regulator [Microbacterium sp. G2-8]|uniref:TetR/AcrR family transcriptional regulator n=1 Tax=Microbacterium sp. G2-8 TaxID=2842454 RepID=UPI001C895C6E|nr:TetR/AcrR family transcriptional regulator [Microbacterium sp. G2-8]